MAKPGVMFCFEIRPCIKRLTLEEKGQLFEAILDYGEYGVIPEVDGAVGVAWDFIQQRLDRDTGRYDERVEQTKYAVAVREAKKKGIQLPPFEKWRPLSDEERERLLSDDNERYPNSTTISTSNSTSISNSTENKESVAVEPPPTPEAVAGKKAQKHKYGEYMNVLLTDDELNKLRAEIPGYEDLIGRLSEYMASTGKKYKSHYATIRSWARRERKAGGPVQSFPEDDLQGII